MDKDLRFIYTNSVNLQLEQIVRNLMTSELYFYKHTKENLAKVSERIDVATGNGLITDHLASYMSLALTRAKMDYAQSTDNPFFMLTLGQRVKLTVSDLSHTSLQKAKSLMEREYKPLNDIFDIAYVPEKFQQLLTKSDRKNKYKLITMFNFLANFEEDDLKKILNQVYEAMTEKDVFIPTFFAIDNDFNAPQLEHFREITR
jgi:uncharacterized protein (UPF0297 family)